MRRLIALVLPCLMMCPAYGRIDPPTIGKHVAGDAHRAAASKDRIARFEKQLEELRQRLRIPGMSAGIVEDQQLAWSKGFGFSDYGNKVAATGETPYEIASISKTFGAALLMQLIEDGNVRLDDPMAKYSTDYTSDSVKVRHVLTHTSEGIPGEHYQYNGNLFVNLTDFVMKDPGKRNRSPFPQNILEKPGLRGT